MAQIRGDKGKFVSIATNFPPGKIVLCNIRTVKKYGKANEKTEKAKSS